MQAQYHIGTTHEPMGVRCVEYGHVVGARYEHFSAKSPRDNFEQNHDKIVEQCQNCHLTVQGIKDNIFVTYTCVIIVIKHSWPIMNHIMSIEKSLQNSRGVRFLMNNHDQMIHELALVFCPYDNKCRTNWHSNCLFGRIANLHILSVIVIYIPH